MLQWKIRQEIGHHRAHMWQRAEETRLSYALDLSKLKDIVSTHTSAVLCMDFDLPEGRYLLTGGNDAGVGLYDLGETFREGKHRFDPLFTINKESRKGAHERPVSCVQWYPLDTGVFVTGSFDYKVKIWDTNRLEVVETVSTDAPVYAACMSRAPGTTQHLIAVANQTDTVKLVDLRTARGTHILMGHVDAVLAAAWSPGHPHQIVTGSKDGTLRLWDIRRPGWVHCYEMARRTIDKSLTSRLGTSSLQVPYSDNVDDPMNAPAAKRRKIDALKKAHYGAVVGVAFTPDSKRLLSTGSDGVMRLWQVETGVDEMVKYKGTKYRMPLFNRICVSNNGKLVYHPNGPSVGVYEIDSGKKIHTLRGHFANVTSMCYHTQMAELYTGSLDGSMLVWTPFLHERTDPAFAEVAAAEASEVEGDDDFWDDEEDDNNLF